MEGLSMLFNAFVGFMALMGTFYCIGEMKNGKKTVTENASD